MRDPGGSTGGESEEIRIGVSSCLLGQEVRYDGAHKRDRYVTDVLGEYFRFVPVCPEVETGMGIPRDTLRLQRVGDEVRMIAPATGIDHTDTMRIFSRRRVRELHRLGLCGYILKKGSPSCGMERVRTYTVKGMPSQSDRGLFADELLRSHSLLPVEEEGRLNDARLRENFIVRVFAYHRLQNLFKPRWKAADAVRFQEREKLLLMAHDPAAQKSLGRLVARIKTDSRANFQNAYRAAFMEALRRPAQTRRHVNALQHVIGYFKSRVGARERAQVLDVIEDYRQGLVPLVVPLTLVRHYVRLHDVEYLRDQTYLEPHPKELMLRNHV